jgi:hypothetical protein
MVYEAISSVQTIPVVIVSSRFLYVERLEYMF